MSIGAYAGVLLALGLVLALVGVAARLLRRFAPATLGRRRLPMDVLQRLAITPRQGLALVRVGDRVVAISTGEGGVRHLFELHDEERRTLGLAAAPAASLPAPALDALPSMTDAWVDAEALGAARRNAVIDDDAEVPAFLTTPVRALPSALGPRPSAAPAASPPPVASFATLMRGAMKQAGVPLAALLLALGPAALHAQQPDSARAPAPVARQQAPIVAPAT
ncbi:MAG TPA: flagellar biosynthetic protein FliO, partial [Gemmatimonadaceae bacterium]|nr:flagellar biosynthetic protein FliO [Gemmatimonadaceae bacterium]